MLVNLNGLINPLHINGLIYIYVYLEDINKCDHGRKIRRLIPCFSIHGLISLLYINELTLLVK